MVLQFLIEFLACYRIKKLLNNGVNMFGYGHAAARRSGRSSNAARLASLLQNSHLSVT